MTSAILNEINFVRCWFLFDFYIDFSMIYRLFVIVHQYQKSINFKIEMDFEKPYF
jgi:hypothetical protein